MHVTEEASVSAGDRQATTHTVRSTTSIGPTPRGEQSPPLWVRRSYSPVLAALGPLLVRRQLRKGTHFWRTALKISAITTIVNILRTVRVEARDDGVVVALGAVGWPRWSFP